MGEEMRWGEERCKQYCLVRIVKSAQKNGKKKDEIQMREGRQGKMTKKQRVGGQIREIPSSLPVLFVVILLVKEGYRGRRDRERGGRGGGLMVGKVAGEKPNIGSMESNLEGGDLNLGSEE